MTFTASFFPVPTQLKRTIPLFFRVYLCLLLFIHARLPMFTCVNICLPMFTRVCLCLIVYNYPCLTRLNLGNIVKQARLNSAKQR